MASVQRTAILPPSPARRSGGPSPTANSCRPGSAATWRSTPSPAASSPSATTGGSAGPSSSTSTRATAWPSAGCRLTGGWASSGSADETAGHRPGRVPAGAVPARHAPHGRGNGARAHVRPGPGRSGGQRPALRDTASSPPWPTPPGGPSSAAWPRAARPRPPNWPRSCPSPARPWPSTSAPSPPPAWSAPTARAGRRVTLTPEPMTEAVSWMAAVGGNGTTASRPCRSTSKPASPARSVAGRGSTRIVTSGLLRRGLVDVDATPTGRAVGFTAHVLVGGVEEPGHP